MACSSNAHFHLVINNFGCRSATEILLTVLKIRNNCAFDEQAIRWNTVSMKRRFDEKALHPENIKITRAEMTLGNALMTLCSFDII
jgi:hypothetical protein